MFAIDSAFTTGFILKTLFRYSFENQRYFTEYYVNCDKSLVYKWINDTVALPKKHVANIVRFSIEQTNDSEKLQIRNIIQQKLVHISLCDESKASLLNKEDFGEFLSGALMYAIACRTEQQKNPYSRLASTGISLPMLLACGFFALISGGILWTFLNRLLGWTYFMGGQGNEPAGLPSFIWGVLSNMPIIVFALLAARKSANLSRSRSIALIALYTLLSGFGAFVFYNSSFRILMEQTALGYVLRECFIAGVYGLIISGFPLLSLYLVLHRSDIPTLWHIAGICLPPAAAVLAVLGVSLINRPEIEIAPLRGFSVALALRFCIFLIVYLYISGMVFHKNRFSSGIHI